MAGLVERDASVVSGCGSSPLDSATALRKRYPETAVGALAIDTASIDYGQSKDFIAHQVLNGANEPAFENVAKADRLPPTGATFIALPLKIEQGTGGPARIIAVVP